ncbi:uncharacterized protein [Temnothorax nylanderi]|uniref:uncharacterized protein n=1 Tax=Temnothorax nylanderi TaxID=102681 RepID=UPI003A8427C1
MLDGNECCFKIDTGSDVSILSRRIVKEGKHIIQIKDNSLRYPTGEVVPIEFKVMAKVLLGRWLMSFKDLEGQLARWLEKLQQYEFKIIHRKGLIHRNANELSRRQCESFSCEYCAKVERRQMEELRKSVARIILIGETLQDWRKEQIEDASIAFIYRRKEAGIRPSRSEIPARDVSARIYWSYWDALSLKDGVLYKRNIRASTVAEVFVNQVISRHGVSLEVHTDQGKNFKSKLFAESMNLLGIRKTRTTALHPQSDGQVERQHQTIINYLAKYISENQKDWDRWVSMFLLAYRSSKHETTGVTPAELYFARDLRLPLDLLLGSPPRGGSQSVGGFIGNLKEKLDRIHSNVRERMDVKSSRAKSWSVRHKKKIVHADRLASFSERQ